jgi:hypothetical protein
MAGKTQRKEAGGPEGLAFVDPHKNQGLTFAVLPRRSASSRRSWSFLPPTPVIHT